MPGSWGRSCAGGGAGHQDGQRVEADYVYVMNFADGRIKHLTKIWNDAHSLQQLGWM